MEEEAKNDLRDDFIELSYLYSSYIEKLLSFKKSLSKIKESDTYAFVENQVNEYLEYFQESEKKLKVLQKKIKDIDKEEIIIFKEYRESFFNNLRTRIGLIGALITSTDWQSPSFEHTLNSQAGVQEGEILANINDYKRDRHLNEIDYQHSFTSEYVDWMVKIPMTSLLVNSGMAALVTILTYLFLSRKKLGPIMVGETIYFQNAELIKNFFLEKDILEVEEMQTKKILDIYDQSQPNVLIFDSLSNAYNEAVPDILEILKHVAGKAQNETFFIIDNSTLSIALQPLKEVVFKTKVKLIVFESLNKYHQFGMDKVTAGIIWFWGPRVEDFNLAREHSGTNIVDSSCYVLPTPNRKMLEKRLMRFNRNATFVAKSILDYLKENPSKKIDTVIYPGLENHPSFEWSKNYLFKGSYFVIGFNKNSQKISDYQRFVKKVMAVAKNKNVNVIGGTSFGLNTTRIYLTATNSKYGTPFVRVSIGTENRLEIEKIKDVFIETISNF